MAKAASIGKRKVKIKITFWVTLALLVLTGLSYGYMNYQRSAAEDAKLPKPSINKLIKDLRGYHKNIGQFPDTFIQVQDSVWKLPQPPVFGDNGQSFTMHNYYYLLNKVTPHAATLWAAPFNERFREANTFFLVIYEDHEEVWKGPALEPKEFTTLPANPTSFQLTTMGLTKQDNPATRQKPANSPTPNQIHF
jgi:hypothetical protein